MDNESATNGGTMDSGAFAHKKAIEKPFLEESALRWLSHLVPEAPVQVQY